MHLASGNINVQRGRLPEGKAGVDATVQMMSKMAKGQWGSRSAKIRALSINLVNAAKVNDKDYFGMAKAIHTWVRDQIRYVKDPIGDASDGSTLNQETLSYPEETAFNSKAGDCDDKTILEMAMLGSLGIQSYPVVIGTQPGRYSHVYLHIILPPGKYPHAGEVIPADPIMREWPLGKEAPAYKVKLKKLYTDLSGIGTMDIGGYASAPSYLDAQNLSSVVPALRSRITDTGSRGRIMNVAEVTRPSEDLDVMFDRGVTINVATDSADRDRLRPLGPITARREQALTSYLKQAPLIARRATNGPVIRTIDTRRNRNSAPEALKAAPTRTELHGLSDYLSLLEQDINACASLQGLSGANDPVNKAAAALIHANSRSRMSSAVVNRIYRTVGMFGLGSDDAVVLSEAQKTEQLAHAVTQKAKALAKKSTNGSPIRASRLHQILDRLKHLDVAFGLPDHNAKLPTGLDPVRHAATKVAVLSSMAQDTPSVRSAHRALAVRAARALPANPLKTPIRGGTVRDQMGRIIYSDDLAGGLKSIGKKISGAVTSAAGAVASPLKSVIPTPTFKGVLNTAFNPLGAAKMSMDIAKKVAGKNAVTAKIFSAAKMAAVPFVGGPMASGRLVKGLIKPKSKSPGAPATAPTSSSQPYTDPATGYVFNPSTGMWTDPATGAVFNPNTNQWSGGSSSGGGGGGGGSSAPTPTPGTSYDSPSAPTETPVDTSSEDYPQDAAPGDTSAAQTSFPSSTSTSPVDTYGPEDGAPAEDDGSMGPAAFDPASSSDPGYDDGSEPSAADAAATLAPMVMVADSGNGFLQWFGSLFVSPVEAMESAGAPTFVPAPAAAAAPAEDDGEDEASEGSLYVRAEGGTVNGLGSLAIPGGAVGIAAVGALAYFLLRKHK